MLSLTSEPAPVDGMSLFTAAFDRHNTALHAYVNNHLLSADWHLGEDLTQQTWLEALESADLSDDRVDSPSGLPAWLGRAARAALRRHHSPAPANRVDWNVLVQILGHTADWPDAWHDVLAIHGQAELLRVAADDMADAAPELTAVPEPAPALAAAA